MDEELALCAAAAAIVCILKKRNKKRRKRLWSRECLRRIMREIPVVPEIDPETTKNWNTGRLNRAQFKELLTLVTPLIEKRDTNMREAVTAHDRLSLTLTFLTSGDKYRTLSSQFNISHPLICTIIPTVCKAIYQVLQPIYLKTPSTAEEWHRVAKEYCEQRDFPMCLGALDGKRIKIKKNSRAGTTHCNNFILVALVDANYKFLYVDLDAYERTAEIGVWDECPLKKVVEEDMLGIPEPVTLPFSNRQCPHVFVGDDAFPLKGYLMKPYPEWALSPDRCVFNYRLSRAKRSSEKAFGILSDRWLVYQNPFRVSTKITKEIVLATLALHNMLIETSKDTYLIDKIYKGELNNALEPLQPIASENSYYAETVRDMFNEYFNNEGSVPWQDFNLT